MTRPEFESFMDAERWSPAQRALWTRFTPTSDARTLLRELRKPDGMIEVTEVKLFRWAGLLPKVLWRKAA